MKLYSEDGNGVGMLISSRRRECTPGPGPGPGAGTVSSARRLAVALFAVALDAVALVAFMFIIGDGAKDGAKDGATVPMVGETVPSVGPDVG